MENVNGFSFQIAKPGVKPSSAIEAGISLTPTLNKFELNGLGSKLIGLVSGTGDKDELKTPENSITILVDDNSKDLDNKFFVCKGIEGNSAKLAAHENEEGQGKALSFTYAGIYSQIMIAAVNKDVEAQAVPKERLRQLGLAKAGTALNKVYAKIEKSVEVEVAGEKVQLYRMFDFMVTDHTPKQFKAKE